MRQSMSNGFQEVVPYHRRGTGASLASTCHDRSTLDMSAMLDQWIASPYSSQISRHVRNIQPRPVTARVSNQGLSIPARFCSRSTSNVSHADGRFLSAKPQPFQARYIDPAV